MICTQPVQNDLMPLSEAKSKNFLTAQSWRHFKITEADVQPLKLRKKSQTDIRKIQYKFQIKEENYHSVLQEMVRLQQKPHLLPLKAQYKPNHAQYGLQIGALDSDRTSPQRCDDVQPRTLKTQQMKKRDILIEDVERLERVERDLRIMSQSKIQHPPTERKLPTQQRLKLGINAKFNKQESQTFIVQVPKTQSPVKVLNQKQFNVYKKKHIAASHLAEQYKRKRNAEQAAYKKWIEEQEKLCHDLSFFDYL